MSKLIDWLLSGICTGLTTLYLKPENEWDALKIDERGANQMGITLMEILAIFVIASQKQEVCVS